MTGEHGSFKKFYPNSDDLLFAENISVDRLRNLLRWPERLALGGNPTSGLEDDMGGRL